MAIKKLNVATLAAASVFALIANGASAQTRTYLVHFDGSCMGMTLHITNGMNVVGNSVGCGEAHKAYVGTIDPGNVANVHSTDAATQLVTLNYHIGLRDNNWVLYETIDGKTEEIGNGFWTKRGPVVEVNTIPDVPAPAPAPGSKP